MQRRITISPALVLTIIISTANLAYGSTLIPLNPTATYLLVDPSDSALNAPAIDLASIGIVPGNTLLLEQLGSYMFASDFFSPTTETVGVFSSSNVLLAPNILNRVAGAIDVGMPFVTIQTFDHGLQTDIPQDFEVTSHTTVVVPAGAAFLFVAADDSRYLDNSDPSGTYAVRLTVTPEPSSIALAASGFAGFAFWGWRRRLLSLKHS